MERLASELESAMVRSELLSAKGQMYDELRAKVDQLTTENQRLQVGAAVLFERCTALEELQPPSLKTKRQGRKSFTCIMRIKA